MKSITHLTSAHPRYDTRIFVKECQSLAKEYEVNLVVADSKGDERKDAVNIYDVGKLSGRFNRIFKTTQNVYKKALELNSDLYHFHDPELLYVGLKLHNAGKKVIYDAHEDIEMQVLAKHYIPTLLRKTLSFGVKHFQAFCIRRFEAVVCATPFITEKFSKDAKRAQDVSNFPIISELQNDVRWEDREDKLLYIGALARVRGIAEIVNSLEYVEGATLNLAGTFFDKSLESEVKSSTAWHKVDFRGFVGREEIKELLATSKIGLVTLHKIINYEDALPVKMFEYMLAGMPVIASDIKLWQSIVDEVECGICVNPYEPQEIAKASNYLLENPQIAYEMGQRGKKAVLEKYNWHNEELKLLKLYKDIL